MKKQILLFITICISALVNAQAHLVFMCSEGGTGNGAGTIIQYTGGATSVAQEAVITPSGNPQSEALVQAPNGKFYGYIDDGVQTSTDILIEYDYVANTYTPKVTFDTSTGTTPAGALLLVGDTIFYGLAYSGGANGSGTIFSYEIGATSVVKLADLPANAYPYGSLMMASDGHLYGMTQNDGAHSSGTIFSYNINTHIYNPIVNLPTYAHPLGSLIEGSPGILYGMVYNDSVLHSGCIFSFNIGSQIYVPLLYFTNTHADGSLLKASDGLLYGMTDDGGIYSTGLYNGGMLFSYDPGSNIFDTLHNFGNGTDGNYPLGDLYQASDGMIYGLTNAGGTGSKGTIFQYNINTHTYTLEVNLDASTGYFPGYGRLTEYRAPSTGGPTITAQPAATTSCVDSAVTFTVADSGANLSQQWQISTNGGTSYSNLSGATGTTYSFTPSFSQNGDLFRVIINGTGGSDTSNAVSLTVDSCTSGTSAIAVLQSRQFSIYPNPVQNILTIEHNYSGKLKAQLIDVIGEKLEEFDISTPGSQMDISKLANGIYYLQISDGQQILKVLKLVKD